MIGRVLQLAHQVAGYQHGAALGGERPQEPAHPHDALRVHAVERLVHHQDRRVSQQRRGDAEPLPHPERISARPALDRGLQARAPDHLIDPPGVQALRVGQPQQVVAGAAAGLQGARVQQRSDMAQRMPQVLVALATDERGALLGGVQPEDHPHRGRLPRAVRPNKAGDLARVDGERHPVQRQRRPEPLAQPGHFDRCFHARQTRDRVRVRSSRGGAVLAAAGTGDTGPRLPRRRDIEMDGQGDARSRRSSENVWMSWVGAVNRVSLVSDGHGRRAGGRRFAAARYEPFLASAALAGFAVLGALTSATVRSVPATPSRAFLLLILALVTLLTTLPLGALWKHPAAAAVTIATATLLSLVGFRVLTVAGLIALLVALYRLGHCGSRVLPAALVLPFLVAALSLSVDPTPTRTAFSGVELRVLATLAASLGPAAAWVGAARRSRTEAVQHSATQQEIAGTLLEHTARGERARISRELHDVVAHHISMIAVQAETARLATPGMPAAGAQRLLQIGDTARAGLTEMRRLLGVLREDAQGTAADQPGAGQNGADRHPQPDLGQLYELVDEARSASGA